MLCGPGGNLTEKVNGGLHVLWNNPLTPTPGTLRQTRQAQWTFKEQELVSPFQGSSPHRPVWLDAKLSHLTLDSSSSRSHYNLPCNGYGRRRGCLASSRKAVRVWTHGLNPEREGFLAQDRSPPAVHKALLASKATWYQDAFNSNSLSAL